MSSSFAYTESETFSVTHAKRIASKVATDLKRFQRFYGSPSDVWIDQYERELVELLKRDALSEIVYGFKRNGQWTAASVRYRSMSGGQLQVDDDPGRVKPNLDVAGAWFTSFCTYRNSSTLKPSDWREIEEAAGFNRGSDTPPPLERGVWADDLTYAAGGRGLGRSSVRI